MILQTWRLGERPLRLLLSVFCHCLLLSPVYGLSPELIYILFSAGILCFWASCRCFPPLSIIVSFVPASPCGELGHPFIIEIVSLSDDTGRIKSLEEHWYCKSSNIQKDGVLSHEKLNNLYKLSKINLSCASVYGSELSVQEPALLGSQPILVQLQGSVWSWLGRVIYEYFVTTSAIQTTQSIDSKIEGTCLFFVWLLFTFICIVTLVWEDCCFSPAKSHAQNCLQSWNKQSL